MSSATKRQLSEKVEAITGSWDWLSPVLPDARVDASRVVQLDATGAATVELSVAGGGRLFAKLFADNSGQAVHDTLVALRATDGAGLGARCRYQAVRPVAYFAEHRLLLCEGAPGRAVSEAVDDDRALLDGVVEAAQWLARLHSSPLRRNRPWSLVVASETLSLARRLAKVVARRPEFLDIALPMIVELERLADDTSDVQPVQSHGQYRPIHVFVDDTVTTVIDLDRSRPCDPARDVAEFLHRLRMTIFWDFGWVARAEAPTRAFLDTYRDATAATAPDLSNLAFHWARYVCHSLNRHLKKDDEGLETTVAFYQSEFDRVAGGEFG